MGMYWGGAFLLRELGPVEQPPLSTATYAYLAASCFLFVVGYRLGLLRFEGRERPADESVRLSNRVVLRHLRLFCALGVLGGLGLVADLVISGSGSVERTLRSTETVRSAMETTALTTVSVVPYAFSFVGLAFYFYAISMRWRMGWTTHALAWGMPVLALATAFLSVNRGQFFWVATYVAFLAFFVEGLRWRDFVRRGWYRRGLVLFGVFAVVAGAYVYFIARNRSTVENLEATGRRTFGHVNEDSVVAGLDAADRGVVAQLVDYATHEFVFTDAFMERADPFAFRPSFLLGARLLSQIKRLYPEYQVGAMEVGFAWLRDADLSPSGWPSIFGWNLVMFGYVGGVVFMFLFGFLMGHLVGHYLCYRHVGSLVITFCLYAALNISFNNIGGDFNHNFGYLYGTYLLATYTVPVHRRRLRGAEA